MGLKRLVKILFLLVVFSTVFSMVACKPKTSGTQVSETSDISWLQTAGNLTVNFSAMMTFEVVGDPCGSTLTFPGQLDVLAVPIYWMGNIFNGVVKDSGPGYYLIDEVHGSISADGLWIEQITYSRKVLRQSANGSNYTVVLHNLPLTKTDSSLAPVIASFAKKGVDVQKHVSNVEYSSGTPGEGGVSTSYVSTDWTDANGVLGIELKFATGTGDRQMGGSPPPM